MITDIIQSASLVIVAVLAVAGAWLQYRNTKLLYDIKKTGEKTEINTNSMSERLAKASWLAGEAKGKADEQQAEKDRDAAEDTEQP